MKIILWFVLTIATLLCCNYTHAQQRKAYNAIYPGVPWFDDRGNVVSAHGACIVNDNNKYYLFGEKHTDGGNAFAGFSCYSSADMYNWKFERMALPVQDSGRLGPNRVGERVKVMKCPQTGGYIMLMHTDDLAYKDQYVGYATSKNITGPYTFCGPILFNGAPVRKWDMGAFQDTDGSGYLLTHGGEAYKLSSDYKSITEHTVNNKWPGAESPAVFKKNGVYYWLTSSLTSWERNDNYYYTAPSMKGPWTAQGSFAPKGTLTWNSQTTFVLPIYGSKDTTYLFMGDRWSYPLQASAATYVWQPLTFSGKIISLPQYHEAWQINAKTGVYSPFKQNGKTISHLDKSFITYNGHWQNSSATDSVAESKTDVKDAAFSLKFNGTQVGFYSTSGPVGGYALVSLKNSNGKTILSCIVDMYCKYPVSGLKFVSPVLPVGSYTLTVSAMGQHSKWSDKRKADYGSTGNYISLQKVIIN